MLLNVPIVVHRGLQVSLSGNREFTYKSLCPELINEADRSGFDRVSYASLVYKSVSRLVDVNHEERSCDTFRGPYAQRGSRGSRMKIRFAEIEHSNSSYEDNARVLLFSMRNVAHHVSRCPGYEFENIIRDCDNVDILAPRLLQPRIGARIARRIRRISGKNEQSIEKMQVDSEYDVFFVFCHQSWDLGYIQLIKNLHARCRKSICLVEELWPEAIDRWSRYLEVLSGFDCIFSSVQSSVAPIERLTGRPCHYIPHGIDAIRFCPYPWKPQRSIDICNIGRRHEALHKVLLARAELGEIFYIYDTTSNFNVIDPVDHRGMLANLIKRTRYFITYPAKFDLPSETGGHQELGMRFFEGAAGGAVMLGMPPKCEAFDSCFDWPDAVIRVVDAEQIATLISDLESKPQRLARIQRDNVLHSLRRHDWIYRWRQILETVGVPHSHQMLEREERLESIAQIVTADGEDNPD